MKKLFAILMALMMALPALAAGEDAYAAYAGAREAEARREADVIDDYTLALIEEGVL